MEDHQDLLYSVLIEGIGVVAVKILMLKGECPS